LRRSYYLIDVFTDEALAGNPLAVVTECDGLDAGLMQAIAREFNLSETVFVLDPKDPVNTARLRIFTPAQEMPFAGHPTIGSAALIAKLRAPDILRAQDVGIVLEEEIGPVQCSVRQRQGQALAANFILPRLPEQVDTAPADEAVAAALGLAVEDIGFANHRPSVYSVGLPFVLVPVAGLAAIARAAPDPHHFEAAFAAYGAARAYLYTAETMQPNHALHARMFAPGFGIREDPATGSAVAALTGALVAFERPQDGSHVLVIEQGFEMGRPSLITLSLDMQGGVLHSASIGGAAVILAQGTLDL